MQHCAIMPNYHTVLRLSPYGLYECLKIQSGLNEISYNSVSMCLMHRIDVLLGSYKRGDLPVWRGSCRCRERPRQAPCRAIKKVSQWQFRMHLSLVTLSSKSNLDAPFHQARSIASLAVKSPDVPGRQEAWVSGVYNCYLIMDTTNTTTTGLPI